MQKTADMLLGYVTAEISGADTARFLNLCAARGVRLRRAQPAQAYVLRVTARKSQWKRVRSAAEASGCTVTGERERGLPRAVLRLRRRWALGAGLVLCLALLFWSSLYVWEVKVVGCREASASEILSALEEAGVAPGAFWPDFQTDLIRCRVLLDVEELCWLTVNVYGSRAVVVVRERVPKPEMADLDFPGHVVADRGGIIANMSVLQGHPVREKGDTVAEGELLVSGAIPSTLANTRTERAMANITARTWYSMTALRESERAAKSYTGEVKTRWALTFGGARLNLYRAGEVFESCDKSVARRMLSVAGVFTLPVGIIRETYAEYRPVPTACDAGSVASELEALLLSLLEAGMEDGEVVSRSVAATETENAVSVTLRAECLEEIGRETDMTAEEIIRAEEQAPETAE